MQRTLNQMDSNQMDSWREVAAHHTGLFRLNAHGNSAAGGYSRDHVTSANTNRELEKSPSNIPKNIRVDRRACVDGPLDARAKVRFLTGGRLRSCVRPVVAAS
jgi:hypothetical protein